MNLKGEKGAALVLTLLMITLIILFITVLTGQVIQTKKQVTTMEKRIDAELLSQMGIQYVQEYVYESLETYKYVDDENLEKELLNMIQVNVVIDNKEGRNFETEFIEFTSIDDGNFEITFESIGTADGQAVETEGTINITIK